MRKISVLGILNFLWGDGICKRGRKGKSGLFFPSKIVFLPFLNKKLTKYIEILFIGAKWQYLVISGENGQIWIIFGTKIAL